jgi:hypothetical protein
MGTEILYPIGIGLKWGLIVFVCLAVIYALIFRYRNISPASRMILRFVLGFGALLLSLPTLLAVLGVPLMILTVLFDRVASFSDKIMGVGAALIVGSVFAVAWWGLVHVALHFERSLQSLPKLD